VVAIIGVQSLRGLADAHAAGIFHRDIKPDNIVLVRSKHGHETVKIVDFGISKLATSGIPDKASTQTTQVLGSPVYMSPEQCRGAKNIDHRSDLFSLGVALFESVTGHLPFDGESFNALMFKIALEDAPDPRSFRPDLDPTFANILLKALSRTADRRYQSAEEFEAALVSWGERWGMGPEDWRRITSAGVRAEMTSYSDSSLSIRIGGHDSSLGATPVRPAFLEGSSSSSPPALVASPSPKQTRSTTARVLPFAALGAVGALAILASTWTLRDRGPSAPAARAAVARDRVVTIAPPPSVPAPRGKLEPDVQETMELGDASDITMSRPKPLALDAGAASMPRLERPRGVAVPRREVKESAEAPRTPSVLEGKSHSTASPPKTTTVIDGRVIETQF
jgi:serine/threonine-protein kinase